MIELTTTGRKSGQARTVLLTSPYQDGDTYVVVASRGGDDQHPAWFLNLRDNPTVEVSVKGQPKQKVVATIASSEERAPTVAEGHRRSQELCRLPVQNRSGDSAGLAQHRRVAGHRVRSAG